MFDMKSFDSVYFYRHGWHAAYIHVKLQIFNKAAYIYVMSEFISETEKKYLTYLIMEFDE